MGDSFVVYPAIDMRGGKVVRLLQGDPGAETVYGDQPGEMAAQWIEKGARWIHVVNLDGALDAKDHANQRGLETILKIVSEKKGGAQVQLGGGLRSIVDIEMALSMGVARVVLGTVLIEKPTIAAEAVHRFGGEAIAGAIDARKGAVRIHGWKDNTGISPEAVAMQMKDIGIQTLIYTNIAHDGMGLGIDLEKTVALAQATELDVIASGGIRTIEDVKRVKAVGLSGVIIGKALYDGKLDLEEALSC